MTCPARADGTRLLSRDARPGGLGPSGVRLQIDKGWGRAALRGVRLQPDRGWGGAAPPQCLSYTWREEWRGSRGRVSRAACRILRAACRVLPAACCVPRAKRTSRVAYCVPHTACRVSPAACRISRAARRGFLATLLARRLLLVPAAAGTARPSACRTHRGVSARTADRRSLRILADSRRDGSAGTCSTYGPAARRPGSLTSTSSPLRGCDRPGRRGRTRCPRVDPRSPAGRLPIPDPGARCAG